MVQRVLRLILAIFWGGILSSCSGIYLQKQDNHVFSKIEINKAEFKKIFIIENKVKWKLFIINRYFYKNCIYLIKNELKNKYNKDVFYSIKLVNYSFKYNKNTGEYVVYYSFRWDFSKEKKIKKLLKKGLKIGNNKIFKECIHFNNIKKLYGVYFCQCKSNLYAFVIFSFPYKISQKNKIRISALRLFYEIYGENLKFRNITALLLQKKHDDGKYFYIFSIGKLL